MLMLGDGCGDGSKIFDVDVDVDVGVEEGRKKRNQPRPTSSAANRVSNFAIDSLPVEVKRGFGFCDF